MTSEAFVFPVSYAQQRLWFIDQIEPGSALYNMPVAFSFKGKVREEWLESSINSIIARHESLRTCFASIDGQPTQLISDSLRLNLALIDLSALPPDLRLRERLL